MPYRAHHPGPVRRLLNQPVESGGLSLFTSASLMVLFMIVGVVVLSIAAPIRGTLWFWFQIVTSVTLGIVIVMTITIRCRACAVRGDVVETIGGDPNWITHVGELVGGVLLLFIGLPLLGGTPSPVTFILTALLALQIGLALVARTRICTNGIDHGRGFVPWNELRDPRWKSNDTFVYRRDGGAWFERGGRGIRVTALGRERLEAQLVAHGVDAEGADATID